jgi:hypothetical protein
MDKIAIMSDPAKPLTLVPETLPNIPHMLLEIAAKDWIDFITMRFQGSAPGRLSPKLLSERLRKRSNPGTGIEQINLFWPLGK